jgi:hypothetical protein
MANPDSNSDPVLQKYYTDFKLNGPLPMNWRVTPNGQYERISWTESKYAKLKLDWERAKLWKQGALFSCAGCNTTRLNIGIEGDTLLPIEVCM